MNENIDLVKILDGCPEGTEFFSPLFGTVKFVSSNYSLITVSARVIKGINVNRDYHFTAGGKYVSGNTEDGECLLFPSREQRDRSKFKRFWGKPKKERFNLKTLQPFDKVLFRIGEDPWRCGFFSHIVSDDFDKKLVCTTDGLSARCVPYNLDTKHLVGTKEDCPEYYRWWEEE